MLFEKVMAGECYLRKLWAIEWDKSLERKLQLNMEIVLKNS